MGVICRITRTWHHTYVDPCSLVCYFFSFQLDEGSFNSDDEEVSGGEGEVLVEGREGTDGASHPGAPPAKRQKKAKPNRKRGARMTASKRAAQFPKEFYEQGGKMWCIACQCEVGFDEMSKSRRHLASGRHQRQKTKSETRVQALGPAAIAPPPEPTSSQSLSNPQGVARHLMIFHCFFFPNRCKPNKNCRSVHKGVHKQDFVAAFLHAGISPLKLDHPSIRGLMAKYTRVAGLECIHL